MSKVTLAESLSTNGAVFGSYVGFALQTIVVETAIVATKSVAWLLKMHELGVFLQMGTLPNGIDVFNQEPEAYAGFLLAQFIAMTKPDPENKDASDTEDEDEDEPADEQDEDAGEEEGESGEEGEEEGDPEDEPEVNGDGGSGDEDEDEDEDDDDDDDDEGEEEEEEDEEEEELQPPAKKRK